MKRKYSILPKIITVFKEGYGLKDLSRDALAGLVVGIIAIPLAIAFAIASGVRPEQGILTAVVAGAIISALGGSRFQIGGPTGAFIVVVAGVIHRYGFEGLLTATIIAGVLLILMGFLRVGVFIKFIPYPVTIGFTAGIALIIAVSQVPDFFGLKIDGQPSDLVEKLSAYIGAAGSFNAWDAFLGTVSLVLLLAWPKKISYIPSSLIVIAAGAVFVRVFGIPVETIADRFGDIRLAVPQIRLPAVGPETVKKVFPSAVSIALLAGIESLLSAVVADGMTGRKHRSNAEIIAQGAANIASALAGGIPATGAIARTAANIRMGAGSPVAGIIHSAVILLSVMALSKWVGMIPMACLAAILVVVAYNMSEWKLLAGALRYPKSDIAIMLTTFLLTVLIDLTVAIQAGIILSMFLLMQRMSDVTHAGFITNSVREEEDSADPNAVRARKVPEGVEVFEIDGVFFFGAVDAFHAAVDSISVKPKVFILRMRKVLSIDAAGIKALEDLYEKMKFSGTVLVLSGVHAQPNHAMIKAGLVEKIGVENVTAHIDAALDRAGRITAGV